MTDTAATIDNHLEVTEARHKLTPALRFGEYVMELLANPDVPADKMEIMLKLWRESFDAQARETYQENYARFQADMPAVNRDGWVSLGPGKGQYPFTTYEQMDKILRPLLTKHGLALQFWSSAPNSREIVVVHGSLFGHGWSRESTYPVPPDLGPGRNALQARGSAQTYAKRYIADLLCNIVRKGKDDDARGALEALIDATQIGALLDLIKETETDLESFLNLMVTGAEALGDVRQRDYSRLLLALQEKARRRRVGK